MITLDKSSSSGNAYNEKTVCIQCANCGARQRFKNQEADIQKLIEIGWFNFGDKLYCSECMANAEIHFKAYFEWFDTFGEAIRFKDVIKEIAER